MFTLYRKEDVNEDGSLKPAALEAVRQDKEAVNVEVEAEDVSKDEDYQEARKKFQKLDVSDEGSGSQTGGDGVD